MAHALEIERPMVEQYVYHWKSGINGAIGTLRLAPLMDDVHALIFTSHECDTPVSSNVVVMEGISEDIQGENRKRKKTQLYDYHDTPVSMQIEHADLAESLTGYVVVVHEDVQKNRLGVHRIEAAGKVYTVDESGLLRVPLSEGKLVLLSQMYRRLASFTISPMDNSLCITRTEGIEVGTVQSDGKLVFERTAASYETSVHEEFALESSGYEQQLQGSMQIIGADPRESELQQQRLHNLEELEKAQQLFSMLHGRYPYAATYERTDVRKLNATTPTKPQTFEDSFVVR